MQQLMMATPLAETRKVYDTISSRSLQMEIGVVKIHQQAARPVEKDYKRPAVKRHFPDGSLNR